MESIFEQMGGTYHKEGDYLIPDLLPPESCGYEIGKYGRMRRRFLQEHHRGIYTGLLLSGELYHNLAETEKSCNERMDTICAAFARQEGVTEALKASDQMEWVRRANSIRSRAEEIVLDELVYTL